MDEPRITDAEFKVIRPRLRLPRLLELWLFGTAVWVVLIAWATKAPPGWYENTAATPPTFMTFMGAPLIVLALFVGLSWVFRR